MRRPELPALTGIRFFAALMVFLSHVPIVPGMSDLAGDRLVFNAGVVGVSFFFVLSGFILTYNYADTFSAGVSSDRYKRFVWDRWSKIYPVHIAALLLEAPMSMLSPNRPFLWSSLPFHLTMLQSFWPSATPDFYNWLNIPSWSISCEWFFYLLAPMAMALVLRSSRGRLTVAVLALVYLAGLGWLLSSASDASRLYMVSWFAPSRFIEFLVGVFLARAFLKAPVERVSDAAASFMQVAGVLLIVAGAVFRRSAPWPVWGGLLYVPGSAFTVFGLALGRGVLAGSLGRSWVRHLGTASFSFYLLHGPMIRIAKNVFDHILHYRVQSWLGFAIVTIVLFGIIQTTAIVMCRFYEIPAQKRLRSLLPRRQASRPVAWSAS